MNTELDRSATLTNGDSAPRQQIVMDDIGIVARLEAGAVVVLNRDDIELFRFHAQACQFTEGSIRFLVEIYSIGFGKGKLVGRELAKVRIKEALANEL